MTIYEAKKMIYEKIKAIFKQELQDENEINKNILFHVVDNLPMERDGKYSKRKV